MGWKRQARAPERFRVGDVIIEQSTDGALFEYYVDEIRSNGSAKVLMYDHDGRLSEHWRLMDARALARCHLNRVATRLLRDHEIAPARGMSDYAAPECRPNPTSRRVIIGCYRGEHAHQDG